MCWRMPSRFRRSNEGISADLTAFANSAGRTVFLDKSDFDVIPTRRNRFSGDERLDLRVLTVGLILGGI